MGSHLALVFDASCALQLRSYVGGFIELLDWAAGQCTSVHLPLVHSSTPFLLNLSLAFLICLPLSPICFFPPFFLSLLFWSVVIVGSGASNELLCGGCRQNSSSSIPKSLRIHRPIFTFFFAWCKSFTYPYYKSYWQYVFCWFPFLLNTRRGRRRSIPRFAQVGFFWSSPCPRLISWTCPYPSSHLILCHSLDRWFEIMSSTVSISGNGVLPDGENVLGVIQLFLSISQSSSSFSFISLSELSL